MFQATIDILELSLVQNCTEQSKPVLTVAVFLMCALVIEPALKQRGLIYAMELTGRLNNIGGAVALLWISKPAPLTVKSMLFVHFSSGIATTTGNR
jgi:hypothetical protein